MISVFNQDVKGIIYLGGVLITIFITVAVKNMIKHPANNPAYTCELFDFPGNASSYTVPSLNSVLIAFTFAYLFKPMTDYNQMNYSIIISLLVLFIIDAVTKITNHCTPPLGVIAGGLIGYVIGMAYYAILKSTGNEKMLYLNELRSNNVVCSKPSEQQFKCSVYKNGQLISGDASSNVPVSKSQSN
tara:strand:+ start:31270 stop:31830 length:561 start_codon:yes stop_codon:yes gene_type:complete